MDWTDKYVESIEKLHETDPRILKKEQEEKRYLSVYRKCSIYTIKALEKAIRDLSIPDSELGVLFERRRKELENYLSVLVEDQKNH